MNNDRLENAIRDIKNIRMTDIEKKNMQQHLALHTGISAHQIVAHPSPYFNIFTFVTSKLAIVYALLIIFGIGGVTVFAAEKAVPGDILYPIKVNVTEPVRSALTVKEKSKILWEAEKANRRLDEAEVLIERGDLSSTSRREIESRFAQHIEKFNSYAEPEDKKIETKAQPEQKQEKEDRTEHTRVELERDILLHTRNLEKLGDEEDKPDQKKEIESLEKNIKEKIRDTEDQHETQIEKQSPSSDKGTDQSKRRGDKGKNIERD